MKLQANLAKSTNAWSRTAGPVWTSFSQSSHCLTDHSVAWSSPDPTQCHSSYSPSSPTDGWKKKRMLARACHLLQRENYITIQCAPLSPPSSLALDKMHVLSSSSPVVLSLTTPGTLLGIRTCKIVWLEESWERNSLIFPERRYTKERNRSSAFVTLSGYNSVSEDQISGFLLPRLYGSLF